MIKKYSKKIAVVCLMLGASCFWLSCKDLHVSYSGYVYDDKTHIPIENVTVTFYGDKRKVTSTDVTGHFAISGEMSTDHINNTDAQLQYDKEGYVTDNVFYNEDTSDHNDVIEYLVHE